MSKLKDITDLVEVDDYLEFVSLRKCLCGKEFGSLEVTFHDDDFPKCPNCNRKFYVTHKVVIYEVVS